MTIILTGVEEYQVGSMMKKMIFGEKYESGES